MTSANVELVRAIYRQWERGDFSSREWATPDFELIAYFNRDLALADLSSAPQPPP